MGIMNIYVMSVVVCLYVDVAYNLSLDKLMKNLTATRYYTVFVPRHTRDTHETPWAITNHGMALGQKGTIWNSGNHKLEGTLLAGRNWRAKGIKPGQYTGRLEYSNDQTGSEAHLQADKIDQTTILNLGFKYNLLQNDIFGVDLTGYYKHYLKGTRSYGKAKYGTYLNINFPILDE